MDFFTEVLTSPQVCLSQDAPDVASAQLIAFRAGAPRTPALSAMGTSYQFVAIPSVTLSSSVNFFDGSLFELGALLGVYSGVGGLPMRIRGTTASPPRVPWYEATSLLQTQQLEMTVLP